MRPLPSRLLKDPALVAEVLRKGRNRVTSRFHQAEPGTYDSLSTTAELALATVLGESVETITAAMHESAMQRLNEEFRALPPDIAPTIETSADVEACYAIVRLLRPSVVVETGVSRGFSSAGILQALEENGHGRLFSVDLPTLSRDESDQTGAAVPERLRDSGRWELTIGPDAREVPRVLARSGTVDVVFYDSDKSYEGMLHTWNKLWAALAPGGVFMSDDIHTNDAYLEFTESLGLSRVVFSKERQNVRWFIGLARKPRTA